MLKTGCILTYYNEQDTLRVSIMSRHTLNDGTTLDRRITEGISYDEHWNVFAPPLKLIGDYYKRYLPWEEFEKRYFDYLDSIREEVENLTLAAAGKDIRLLCIEKTSEKCHRRLLAERCKENYPELEVLIE